MITCCIILLMCCLFSPVKRDNIVIKDYQGKYKFSPLGPRLSMETCQKIYVIAGHLYFFLLFIMKNKFKAAVTNRTLFVFYS